MKPPAVREWLHCSHRALHHLSVRRVYYTPTEYGVEIALVWIDPEGICRRRLSSAITLPPSEGDPLLDALLGEAAP